METHQCSWVIFTEFPNRCSMLLHTYKMFHTFVPLIDFWLNRIQCVTLKSQIISKMEFNIAMPASGGQ